MNNPSLDIARSVADAGALYAEERWMAGETDAIKRMWRGRIYDALFAAVIHAIDLHEKLPRRRRKRRKSVLLRWCLKCRAQLRVPRSAKSTAIRCPTCGNVQATGSLPVV